MPLVRFELKNEYGLGDPRLYQGAPKEEQDPRNILAGATVSGLVGILRQLGDLAELAAVVFHDVHQQVMTTAARGHKVLNRIKKIEATLPQLEKAVQEQKSHIHFAYITGCNWHANIQTGQSQLVFSDLPEFMLDSYEECRDPPRLHLLDKFDSAGSGACLKRYSDPSYFRMLMARSDSAIVEKSKSGMKVQKKKRRRSRGLHGLARHSVNMTLHGRSDMQFASLVPDGLTFSVDDGSISDTLSISGFTTELTYLSSDKRSDYLKVLNSPSPMSKKMYDGMLTTNAERKVDCIFNNENKVSSSDYVIQDSLHQQNDLFSSSISCDEQTEMFMPVSQIPCHDIPVDGLNLKSAELSCSLSNKNHLNDFLGMQGEHISKSLTWDENATDNPEIQDKSAAWNEQAEIIESSSSKFPDGIIHYRPPDLDLLFVTLETSNRQSEMDDTEMEAPSIDGSQISELTSQLYKHMDDATDALDSNIKTNFGHHTGQEVILLPHLNYNGMECVINNSPVTTPSLDGADVHEACNSLKKNYSLQVIFDHLQLSGPAESESRMLYSVENAFSKSLICDSTMKNDSEGIHSSPCRGDIVPITQRVAIDGIPPEDSLCQDSFGDKSAKIVREKEGLSEHRTKQKLESTADSNCQGTESHCSTEKMIAASKLDCSDSETHLVSCSSASCPVAIIDGVPPEESFSKDYFGGTSAKSTNEKELFCERQIKGEAESTEGSNCQGNEYQISMEKVIAASNFDDSDSETHAASTNSAGFRVINGIPPEESLSQDSFGDTSAKSASEQEAHCEHENNQGKELMINSNCQGTKHQISTEEVIASSKFDVPNSSDAYASPILCGLIVSNNVDNISSSTLGSNVNSSGSPIDISSPRNDSEDPLGNVSAQSSNKSVILSAYATASTTVVSRGFPVDSFRKSSINIWSNGGLLGLKPSKPPDISAPNAYNSDDIYDDGSLANSQPHDLGSGNESRKLFAEADKLNLISFPEQDNIMGKISNEQSDSMLSNQRPKGSIQASPFWKIAKAQNAHFSEIDGVQGKNGGTFSSEDDIYTKNGPESTVSRQNNIGMSVGFSSLAHRFLLSSLQRKSPISGIAPLFELMNNDAHKLHGTKIHSKDKERPKLAISLPPLHKLGNNEDSAHAFSENLVAPSFDSSGYQSPPLEHMKVSFQPMNDTDVSKLNLEFPTSQQQGNMGNAMFPSFQLLAESFHPLSDGALESDDDTFCRSCPYSSDDLLSLHSESDAEIWGEGEIDISCRMEATGSISNSNEFNDCNACRVSRINDVADLKHGSDEQSLTHVT